MKAIIGILVLFVFNSCKDVFKRNTELEDLHQKVELLDKRMDTLNKKVDSFIIILQATKNPK
jgi:chaperonin cofactor prefoldin